MIVFPHSCIQRVQLVKADLYLNKAVPCSENNYTAMIFDSDDEKEELEKKGKFVEVKSPGEIISC